MCAFARTLSNLLAHEADLEDIRKRHTLIGKPMTIDAAERLGDSAGRITRLDWLQHRLQEAEIVEAHEIAQIMRQFDTLGPDAHDLLDRRGILERMRESATKGSEPTALPAAESLAGATSFEIEQIRDGKPLTSAGRAGGVDQKVDV